MSWSEFLNDSKNVPNPPKLPKNLDNVNNAVSHMMLGDNKASKHKIISRKLSILDRLMQKVSAKCLLDNP